MSAIGDILLAPDVRPFAIAAAIMIALGGIELLTTLVGVSISQIVGDGVSVDADSHHGLDGLFLWINAGRLPLLILMILALGVFAIVGFLLQAIAHSVGTAWIISGIVSDETPNGLSVEFSGSNGLSAEAMAGADGHFTTTINLTTASSVTMRRVGAASRRASSMAAVTPSMRALGSSSAAGMRAGVGAFRTSSQPLERSTQPALSTTRKAAPTDWNPMSVWAVPDCISATRPR